MKTFTKKGNREKRICAAVVLTIVMVFATAGFSLLGVGAAYAAEGDTLTIRVGYLGTDYVERVVYTNEQLRKIGTYDQAYTWIDMGNFPVMQAARGVSLTSVLEGAGIDPGSVQRIYFKATDGHNANFEYTRQILLETPRYYYPDLCRNWDAVNNCPGPFTEDTRVPVEPMIALEQYWNRWDVDPRWDLMDTQKGYRLVYGMVGLAESVGDASNSVHSLIAIDVQLVGSPPEEPGENDDEDIVGSDPENNDNDDGADEDEVKEETPDDEVKEEEKSEDPEPEGSGDNGKGKGIGEQEGDGMGNGSPVGNHIGGSLIGSSTGVDRSVGERITITLSNGETVTAKALLRQDAVGLAALASAGGSDVGDNPWTIYEISPESVPLLIPPDNEMIPFVSGALLLIFVLGGLGQYLGIRKSAATVEYIVVSAMK
ncbi:MAG: hypothetical protein LBQ21_02385 [Clostridiales Family XIII bacterium]|jgi:hypothetical protein|nr:hypothetical protein [Clostridiales Family XIII bacterium]